MPHPKSKDLHLAKPSGRGILLKHRCAKDGKYVIAILTAG